MRILVCGGRDYADYFRLRDVLDEIAEQYSKHYNANDNWLPHDITIISGKARGADQMAIEWAILNLSPYEEYPADWETHGKKAGFLRNQEMLDEGKPDLVVAFPGGNGTADMVRRAKKAGVKVIKID